MASQERWSTTVHDLMLNFREALTALTTYLDRVKIGWRDEEAYDDWDNISQALYENMVVRSVRFSTERLDGLIAPEYGIVYPSYSKKSFIEVAGGMSPPNTYKVFVDFSTSKHPFDQVRYQTVSGSDLRAVGELECLPFGEVNFKFVLSEETGEREELSTLLVEL